jgi:hypothetical protein
MSYLYKRILPEKGRIRFMFRPGSFDFISLFLGEIMRGLNLIPK